MYPKILVPIDGSETADDGLSEAIRIAKSESSTIFLLHIVNEFVFDYPFNAALYGKDLLDSLRESGKSIVADAAARVRRQGLEGVSIVIESIGGPASDLIVSKSRELRVDLIVMGTHGRRGLRRLALGSDAEEVLRLAGVPVLLVKHAQRRAEPKAVA